MAEEVEKTALVEGAPEQDLQLRHRGRGERFALNGPPWHHPFPVRADRADAGVGAVRCDDYGSIVKQRWNLALVDLQVLECVVRGRVLVGGILEFNDGKRQPVHEHDNIRAAVALALDHGELVDGEPVVSTGRLEIDQLHAVAGNAAILAAVLHFDPVAKHGVKAPVRSDE